MEVSIGSIDRISEIGYHHYIVIMFAHTMMDQLIKLDATNQIGSRSIVHATAAADCARRSTQVR